MSLIASLVKEDFGLGGRGRWLRSDIHSSLVVDDEKNVFYFNARGISGTPLDYLIKVRGWNYETAKQFVSRVAVGISGDGEVPNLQVKFEKLVSAFHIFGKNKRDYWYKRGLTDSTIDLYRLGHFEGWSLIPIFDNAKFVNFQCRRDEPTKKINLWYKDPDFIPVLFNGQILKFVSQAYITEGLVDCILLNQLGFPTVCTTNGANHWNNNWIKYFSKIPSIYYIADNDKAGSFASQKISRALGNGRVRIVRFQGKAEKYDAVDFFRDGGTIEEFKSLVSNSVYGFEV